MGESAIYFQPADVFAALASAVPAFAGLTYDTLGLRGAEIADGARATAGTH